MAYSIPFFHLETLLAVASVRGAPIYAMPMQVNQIKNKVVPRQQKRDSVHTDKGGISSNKNAKSHLPTFKQ